MVKYLGPLRDDPKALYPLVANIDPRDVGLRGEHTAAVFHVHRDQIIEYLPTDNFINPKIVPLRARRSLKFAVFEWLKYLGVATAVDTKDLGKLGHAMQVRLHDGDTAHDLTHVGVGVSQVLPIVVSCLLAKPDTLLIFEQPELHLHPKVQTLLADFFLAMSMLGKQCILETHSEYLISRLRFRAAAAEAKQLVDTMEIYFVEKSGNQANFRKVKINEYGAIIDWPEGFFDQSQREAEQTLKAGFAKKQEERKKR
jgi:predicted ATPase